MSADSLGELIDRAAKGDRDAQTALSLYSLTTVAVDTPELEAVVAAEAFAHMAAAHGGAGETLHLASVLIDKAAILGRQGDTARAQRTRADADDLLDWVAEVGGADDKQSLAALLEGRADAGDEAAALRLNKLLEEAGASDIAALLSGAKQKRREGDQFASELQEIITQRAV